MAHEGGCQCGAVRYRIVGEPLTLYVCHCTECQKQASSAFGMSLWVRRDEFELEGEPKLWERGADSGRRVLCAFCPECGSRLFHAASRDSKTVSVKAGSLDDTSWLEPVGHIWTRSRQSWVTFDERCYVHETEPESFDVLVKRYHDNRRSR